MFQKNKGKWILSSLVLLLPIVVGLFLWKRLPDRMPIHWGLNGTADGWSGPATAVFGLPLILLALHWFCLFCITRDQKNKDQNKKVLGIVYWICPGLSLMMSGILYASAFGMEFQLSKLIFAVEGLIFVFLGSFLPKCKQNYTIGIRVKWALENEENWNATHRFGGKIFVGGGLLLLACLFLPEAVLLWLLFLVLSVAVAAPIVYSFVYYKRHGTSVRHKDKATSKLTLGVGLFLAVIFVGILILCSTGRVAVQYGETGFTVEATYWKDLHVEYAAIDRLEYREACNPGSRENGFGSPRLSLGLFENDEFGRYTRYSYTKCNACVVLSVDGKILVIGGKDEKSTAEIFDQLLARTNE